MANPTPTAADLEIMLAVSGVTYRQLRDWRRLGIGPQPRVTRAGQGRSVSVYADVTAATEWLSQTASLMRRGRPWQLVALILAARGFPVTDRALHDAYEAVLDSSLLARMERDDATEDDIDAGARDLERVAADSFRLRGLRSAMTRGLRDFERSLPPGIRQHTSLSRRSTFEAAARLATGSPLIESALDPVTGERLPSDAEILAAAAGAHPEQLPPAQRDSIAAGAASLVPTFLQITEAAASLPAATLRESMGPARATLDAFLNRETVDAETFDLLVALFAPMVATALGALTSALEQPT